MNTTVVILRTQVKVTGLWEASQRWHATCHDSDQPAHTYSPIRLPNACYITKYWIWGLNSYYVRRINFMLNFILNCQFFLYLLEGWIPCTNELSIEILLDHLAQIPQMGQCMSKSTVTYMTSIYLYQPKTIM